MIGVAIFSYNRPKMLVEAIKSCKGADEIVVMDDGSDMQEQIMEIAQEHGGVMRLTPVPVEYSEQWEALRVLRNECREFFTNDTALITESGQAAYMARCATRPGLRHYLFYYKGIPVGFCRLSHEGVWVIPTYGLHPEFRGKGLGRKLIAMTYLMAGGPIRGSRLVTNSGVRAIDESLGARTTSVSGGVEYWECPWPPPFVEGLL